MLWLLTRFFLDGLPGTAGHRPNHLRGPMRCWGCGARCVPKWKWLSPADAEEGGNQAGVAWCAECCPPTLPATNIALAPTEDKEMAMPGARVPTSGIYTRCPLCNMGEAGAEHLVIFCPVAHEAWTRLGTPRLHWWLGWGDHREQASQTTRLALQYNYVLAFLATSLGHEPVHSAEEGVRVVLTQVLQRTNPGSSLPLEVGHSIADTLSEPEDRRNQWSATKLDPEAEVCWLCGEGCLEGLRTWHGKHNQRAAYCEPAAPSAALAAAHHFRTYRLHRPLA